MGFAIKALLLIIAVGLTLYLFRDTPVLRGLLPGSAVAAHYSPHFIASNFVRDDVRARKNVNQERAKEMYAEAVSRKFAVITKGLAQLSEEDLMQNEFDTYAADLRTRYDHNDDGEIANDEFSGDDFRFEAIDADNDNFISMQEWWSSDNKTREITQRFSRADEDDDGNLTAAEYFAFHGGDRAAAAYAKELDANDDGTVDRDESNFIYAAYPQ